MLFTDVGYNCYIQTEKVKFVIMYGSTKASRNFVKKAEESNKMLDTTIKKSTLTLVVLEDDTVLRSPLAVETVAQRLTENGHKLLLVESGYYISVFHIKAITERESVMAVALRNVTVKAGSDLQFVRQKERSVNSVLLMTTGESVNLSKYTKELVDDVEKLWTKSPNGKQ